MRKKTRRGRSRGLSIFLTLAMAAAMLVAFPSTAHAVNGPVTINVGTLSALTPDNSANSATESQWTYDDTTKILKLIEPNGMYTLRGSNSDLMVSVEPLATNANVTLDNVDIHATATTGNSLIIYGDNCTITVVGNNVLSCDVNAAIFVDDHISPTITSTTNGTLTAIATTNLGCGIWLIPTSGLNVTGNVTLNVTVASVCMDAIRCGGYNTISVGVAATLTASGGEYGINHYLTIGAITLNSNNNITASGSSNGISISTGNYLALGGTGTVTSVGGPGAQAIGTNQPIRMADDITLVMTNSGGTETHTFTKTSPATTHQWKLTIAATTTDPLTNDSIAVTVPAGTTGTVSREPKSVSVCEIIGTGADVGQYTTLGAALAVVSNGNTIRLLANIPLSADLVINAKRITFDTNNYTLDFGGFALEVENASDVTFNGCARFANLGRIRVIDFSKAVFNGNLVFTNATFGVLRADNGADVTVNGSITSSRDGVVALSASTVTVNGDVRGTVAGVSAYWENTKVTINGSISGAGRGVDCYHGATVTVTGNVAASGAWSTGVYCTGYLEHFPDLLTQVFVKGNVSASGDHSRGVEAWTNGQVTIDGTLSADTDRIMVNGITQNDRNPTSLKSGYDQYSDTPGGALATITAVWLKTPRIPQTGDSAPIGLLVALVLSALGAFGIAWARRRRPQRTIR